MKTPRLRIWIGIALWTAVASGQYVPNRYIVELSAAPAAELAAKQAGRRAATTAALPQSRADVRARQQAMRATVEQTGAAVLGSVDTVANALIIETSPDNAARLASLPGVARVHPVREFKLLLDRAAVLHRADRAWAVLGQDHAGLGAKIAIIDTGIDTGHAGFQDSALPALAGYPKVNDPSDVAFTNRKVIVARSYAALFARRDPDPSARDRVGHGTALAMCAAGVSHAAPQATIAGIAPSAYLGSYKVFGTPGVNDTASEDAILKAIDDAVADGMDVINLSFGSSFAPRLEDDIEVDAIERASALGVIVVVASGNDGPDPFTISSPATAPSAIAVGASFNSRTFATSAAVGDSTYPSAPAEGRATGQQVAAPLADVAAVDGNGLACAPLPGGSLSGRIALVLRGVCTFEEKLINTGAAGAVAALVYTDADRPDPVPMSIGAATLPAQMVGYDDGVRIKSQLASAGGATVQALLRFTIDAVAINARRVAPFSSRGPNVNGSIKPDLLAAGTDIYTATERFDPRGDMYSADGYIVVDGTSFSTPLVAGAAALLKAARPGLTPAAYRSLLVNSASPLDADSGVPVQRAGAGLLDVSAALDSAASSEPAALSFGVAGRSPHLSQALAVRNLGGGDAVFAVSVQPLDPNGPRPALSADTLPVTAGSAAELDVQLADAGLAPGAYEGFVVLQNQASGAALRIPYWYAVPGAPQQISVVQSAISGRAGGAVEQAVLFRVFDSSGVPLTAIDPNVSIEGGSVLQVALREDLLPGVFSVDVSLDAAPGAHLVHIQAGNASGEITIRGR